MKAKLCNIFENVERDTHVSEPPSLTIQKVKDWKESHWKVNEDLPCAAETAHFKLRETIPDPWDRHGRIAIYDEVTKEVADLIRNTERERRLKQEREAIIAAASEALSKKRAAELTLAKDERDREWARSPFNPSNARSQARRLDNRGYERWTWIDVDTQIRGEPLSVPIGEDPPRASPEADRPKLIAKPPENRPEPVEPKKRRRLMVKPSGEEA